MQVSADAEWVSYAELRSRFGLSRQMTNRLIAANLIEARKVGVRTLINIPSVRHRLNHQPRPTIKADDRVQRLLAAAHSYCTEESAAA
jgi:hypothetical protein